MKKAERDDRIFQALCAFDEKRISLAQARAQLKDAGLDEEAIDQYLFDEVEGESQKS